MSAEVAAELFEAKAMQECPERAMALLDGGRSEFQVLHSLPADKRGVRHVLLKGKGAQLQYIASYLMPNGEHEALVVDPPACSANGHLSFLEAQAAQGIPNISSSDPIDPNIAAATRGNTSGGEANMLTLDDPLVHDCKMLFVRTMQERCNKSADVSVLVARRLIVDGLSVQMHVQVCKPNTEECKPHRPECDFETSSSHTDASLLQAQNGAQDDTPPPLPEEAMGLVATLRLAVELCDADTQPGVNGEDAGDDANLAQYAMGEDSGCKGNEHVYDNIPVYSALEVDTPAEVDFRTKYPKCFPALAGKGAGTETVRNQGTCGSCWAFASATAAMANLCVSGTSHSLATATDRYEVSVQKIISCPLSSGQDSRGCNGGNMGGFGSQAKQYGLTKERDNLYMCGAGNPKDHFAKKSNCAKFPWNGQCNKGAPNPAWWWGGAARVDGETKMMSYIAGGMSLYVSMDIYKNFFQLRKGVYDVILGTKQGGHAMNGMGYGIDGGKKFWLLQNSWGSDGWGENGYGKILRGTNLAGVENGAFAPRVWVEGGKQPTCQDSAAGSGLSSTGAAPYAPCSQVKSYCHWSSVKANCPKTCGGCGGSNGANAKPAPAPKPTPSPGPSPPGGKKKCCSGSCASSADCSTNLFCCPGHRMCMDKTTMGNYGPNCKICTNGGKPAPTPAPKPSPKPSPAPAGSQHCGFEKSSKPYCGLWEDFADKSLAFKWTRRQGKTPSSNTGPSKASEGKSYMYIETSSPRKRGDKAVLKTTAKLGKGAFLQFAYNMNGRNIGELKVFAAVGTGTNPTEEWKMSGNKNDVWKTAKVDLDKYAGSTIDIGIMGIRGSCWAGDIAIDDVTLYSGASGPAPGPSPTPATTAAPTTMPTVAPTVAPTMAPTVAPTVAPTAAPTVAPTVAPTAAPTVAPTAAPTVAPTVAPTTSAPPGTSTQPVTPTVAPTTMAPPGTTVAPGGGSSTDDKVNKLSQKVDDMMKLLKQILGMVR